MSATDQFDVVVVGGGPAGYTVALRCAERGMSTAVVERDAVGGTCLNVGCIPSKAVIHAADKFHRLAEPTHIGAMGISVGPPSVDLAATMRWKDGVVAELRDGVAGLLDRGGIDVRRGDAEIIDARTVRVAAADGNDTVSARHLVLAPGSRPVELSNLPFGDRVLSSTGLLEVGEVPIDLAVVGGGYIGLELGTAMAKLGSNVTVVEAEDRVLPAFDTALVRPVARRLTDLGIDVRTATRAVELGDGNLVVEDRDGARSEVSADQVVVAVGRRPATDGMGLARLGLDMDGAAIAVDGSCRTSVHGVFAIGDVTGEPMLAHRAYAQAELVADVLAGEERTWDHLAVPAVCFTDPEICAVGMSPDDVDEGTRRDRLVIGQASYRANGRSKIVGAEDGMVRVVADRTNGAVLGVQAVGPEASELAAAASLAVELGSTLDDLAATIIAHPTLAETFADAVAAAIGRRDSASR